MVMKERDEELALFLEMRRREKEKEKNNNLLSLHNSEQLNAPLGSNVNVNGNGGGGSPISKIVSAVPVRKTAADIFLNSENEKSDYDWLLTPPGTPLFPSLEMESQKTLMSQIGMSNARPTALKTRLANHREEPASKSTLAPKQQTLSAGLNSSTNLNKRPSSSGGPKSASRPATPTGRPTLPTATKPTRSSTPTSRATLPSTKPAASTARSSTPTRSTARSSTPTARPSLPASKSTSRSATPTRRPATSSSTPIASAPTGRSSSVTRSAPTTSSVPRSAPLTSSVMKSAPPMSSATKSAPTTSKNSVPSRGTSPTVKSRPWKPSEMPGFSLDTPPNLRTSLPERPASATRGRPAAGGTRSASVEASSNGRPRRQSCSPARSRASSGSVCGNGSSIRSARRADTNGSDNDSPVVIGTKMVERVVNMRKLVPPKQDDNPCNNPTAKLSASLDSSGFGRTLSKKSLDMALRHMDIRRSIPGNQRPLMTNVPASSIYSVRSGSTKSRTVSVSDSPLATSSNASSEPSVNNNSFCIDGIEMEYNDLSSERGNSSPTSQPAR
ncbi:PREDICTED: flocculation protein FLO11 [Theobroma cacao]|uniref:Flocculation protein FLO11 n=1 Tax=Theobroma cacao TaxID=3641 RepID=A0AB32V1P8_THECC|nr:PREDICTED: flocculation protein FLO11 [Theobroma cacao]